MSKYLCIIAIACIAFVPSALAQDKLNPFGASQVKVFKTIGNVKLHMRIYLPEGHKSTDKRPAIVFFFGGGWMGGSPKQFAPHAKYFASRGMVAMTAEYRVYKRHKVKVAQCVSDAKSAIRWVRTHAKELGIDPQHIVASGGSAGGHLAAAVATLKDFEPKGEDTSIRSRPNALILFNPALDLRAAAFNTKFKSKKYQALARRFGAKAEQLSPNLHIKKGTPPALVIHGKADTTVPYSQAEQFAQAMKKAGNRCELAGYEGQSHGFFNFGRAGNKNFIATTRRADEFLASLGYLKGAPTVEQWLKKKR